MARLLDDQALTNVVYICSSWLQLACGSRDLSKAENRSFWYVCRAEKKKKMIIKIVLDEQSCHFE